MRKLVVLALASVVLCAAGASAQSVEGAQPAAPDLSSIKGKTVLLCTGSELYKPDYKDGKLDTGFTRLSRTSFSPFMKAEIKDARVVRFSYGSYTVAVALSLPNGDEAAVRINLSPSAVGDRGDVLLAELLDLTGRQFLRSVPIGLKDGESVNLERGMPLSVARCLLGPADHENDYGMGGKQLVFNGGRTVLYVADGGTTVREIQRF